MNIFDQKFDFYENLYFDQKFDFYEIFYFWPKIRFFYEPKTIF